MSDPVVWAFVAVAIAGVMFGVMIGYVIGSGEDKEAQLSNAAEIARLSFVVYKVALAIGVQFDENENED